MGFVWNIFRHSQCPRHSLWKVSSRLSHLSRRRWGPYKHRYATIIIIVSVVSGMWECFSWERCLLFSAVCLESCLECGLHINHKIIPVRDIWGDFFFFILIFTMKISFLLYVLIGKHWVQKAEMTFSSQMTSHLFWCCRNKKYIWKSRHVAADGPGVKTEAFLWVLSWYTSFLLESKKTRVS